MGSFSAYLENKVVLHLTGQQAYTQPQMYLALCRAKPSNTSTGVGLPEISNAGGYERIPLNLGPNSWAVLNFRTVQNLVSILSSEAIDEWEPITHWALVDSGEYRKGNMLVFGEFTASTTVKPGKRFHVDPYRLTIRLEIPGISNYGALKFLNHLFGIAEYPMPVSLYLGLGLSDTEDPDVGVTEPADITNYSRLALVNWYSTVDSLTYSDAEYTFLVSGMGWGEVKYFAIFEDVIGDNMLVYTQTAFNHMLLNNTKLIIPTKKLLMVAS